MIELSRQELPGKRLVHVWHVSLENPELDMPELLSSSELSRYAKYSSEYAQSDYLRTRVALRSILSSYLERSPSELQFLTGENGKPELSPGHSQLKSQLNFNLSHSGQYLLICAATSCDLGIDIERVKLTRDYLALASRFYTPNESRMIKSSDDDLLFYRMWVLKEAAVKARGMKLFAGLDRFECFLGTGQQLSLRDKRVNGGDQTWAIRQWQESGDYVAAIIAMCKDVEFIDKKL